MMETRFYRVRFTTPAFLGDAEQSGRWRTPPFKHLLREWWRVAWAMENDPADWQALRMREALLFGHAWLEADTDAQGRVVRARRSLFRMRLSSWEEGGLRRWRPTGRVRHPEVGHDGADVGADLYLGYGPLTYDRQGRTTALKRNAAIQAGEAAELRLAWPQEESVLLDRAVALAHAFGALGGRSRNGWGSVAFENVGDPEALPLDDWRSCLERTWAHAIGRDESGPLIWRTEPHADWSSLMQALAQIKIGLRTRFRFRVDRAAGDREIMRRGRRAGIRHGAPQDRHWLAYPVTNHPITDSRWSRLPNSLRFKVRGDEGGGLRGVIFHMPCSPPQGFQPDTRTLIRVWRSVHRFLDEQPALERSMA